MKAPGAGALGPLLGFCLVLLLAACAGIGAVDPQKRANIRTIGVVSALPQVFHVQDIGLTVFGNDLKEIQIASWGLDEYATGKIRTLLGKRYEVKPVVYDRATIAAATPRFGGDLSESIKAHVSTQGLDAYIILKGHDAQYPGTNQYIDGFGIVEYLNINYTLFAFYDAKLIDGHDHSQLGFGGEPVNQKVDRSWWPTSLDPASNPRLKAALVAALDQSLPGTLKRLGLVE